MDAPTSEDVRRALANFDAPRQKIVAGMLTVMIKNPGRVREREWMSEQLTELGDKFDEHRQYLWERYRDRFVIFANVDWQGSGQSNNPSTWDCHRPASPAARRSCWPMPNAAAHRD